MAIRGFFIVTYCHILQKTAIFGRFRPVRPSPRLFDAGDDPGGLIFLFISLILNHFSIILCIFQKESVSLQKIGGTRQFESKLSLRSLA
ncbi:hypothetical protein V7T09_01640 [Segatella copri]|uniref:hypothetical protein n=1 Tax=Segatella copri TaxID=165179 RepID=UPI001C442BBD|nr:hypothetical protein [Segatella copri]MBW0035670.1 hypothetical protein [Segatella copri]